MQALLPEDDMIGRPPKDSGGAAEGSSSNLQLVHISSAVANRFRINEISVLMSMKNKLQLQAISFRSDRDANHPKNRRGAEGTAITIHASHFTVACPLNCPQSPCCPHRACWLKCAPCYTTLSQRTLVIQR